MSLFSLVNPSYQLNKTDLFIKLFIKHELSPTCRYELGAALFIGWAGASLCIIGGSIFCFSIAENKPTQRYRQLLLLKLILADF